MDSGGIGGSGVGGPSTGQLIGAGISTAGNIAGGLLANSAAGDTADAALKAAAQANALQEKEFNQSRQDLAPWVNTGGASLGRLSYLLGLNPGNSSQGAFNANYSAMGTTPGTLPAGSGTGSNGTIGGLVRNGMSFGSGGNANTANPGTNFDTAGQAGGLGFGAPTQDPAIFRNGLTANDYPAHWNPETQGTFAEARGAEHQGNKGGGTLSDLLRGGTTAAGTAGASSTGTNDGQFGSLMHDFSATDFQADPGYAFRLSEGQQALERSAAARGGLFSGGMLKDLTKYNQDFASNEYGNAFNRWNINQSNKYNRLANLAGLGQVSTGQLVNAGQNYANQAGTNLIASQGIAAGARASGYGALANGLTSGANTIGQLYGLGRA
jgi:hypothetical protein